MVTINYVIFIFSKIVFERVATANSFLRLPRLQELRVSCWRLSEQEYKNLDDTVRMSGWDLKLSRRSTVHPVHNF